MKFKKKKRIKINDGHIVFHIQWKSIHIRVFSQVPVQVSNQMGMMQPIMRPAMALAPAPAQFGHIMRPGHHHPMGLPPGTFY